MSLYETSAFAGEQWEGEAHESQETELAQELLEVSTEAELEQFLGKLIRGVAKGAGALMKSPIGKALGGVLRNVAKTALPVVGSAIGSFVAPGLGTVIGGKLGSMASGLLEVHELESMNEAEAEFEAARRYVRWASQTVRNSMNPPRGLPPRAAVRAAAIRSAQVYAPSLLNAGNSGGPSSPDQRWRQRRRPGYVGPQLVDGQTCSCGGSPRWGADQYPDQDSGEPDGGSYESAFESNESEMGNEAFESFESFDSAGPAQTPRATSGRWVRRGTRIVLLNV